MCLNWHHDAACNWRGTERWLDELERTGLQELYEAIKDDWVIESGEWKRISLFSSFAYVRGADNTVSARSSMPENTPVDLTSNTPPPVIYDA